MSEGKKAREWTVYVRHGRLVPGPLMNAEAVPVRELLPEQESELAQLREENEQLKSKLENVINGGFFGRVSSRLMREKETLQSELTTLRAKLEKAVDMAKFYAASAAWSGPEWRTISLEDVSNLNGNKIGGKIAREFLKEIGEK